MKYGLRTLLTAVALCGLATAGVRYPTGFLFVLIFSLTCAAIVLLFVSAARFPTNRLARLSVAIALITGAIIALLHPFPITDTPVCKLIWNDLSKGEGWFHFSGAVFLGIVFLLLTWIAAGRIGLAVKTAHHYSRPPRNT